MPDGGGMIDAGRSTASRLRNFFHSVVLILGIGGLCALCAYTVWGWGGVIGAGAAALLIALAAPRIAGEAVMKFFKAQPVDKLRGGQLLQVLEELSRRAGLAAPPRLYVIPSPTLNAFATGSREDASIAVTEALLRRLSLREMAGVLAHEVAHVRNNDLWIMGLADVMSRLTRLLSLVGLVIFFFQLPMALAGQKELIPWKTILLLYFAPAISSLLQLALSRAREYDADLQGARLTGDPEGLAMALAKLERYQGRIWEDIFMPSRRIPQPSVLRSHPATAERIARLRGLASGKQPDMRVPETEAVVLGLGVLPRRPRYHFNGYWY